MLVLDGARDIRFRAEVIGDRGIVALPGGFDPLLELWVKKLPADVVFTRVPVTWGNPQLAGLAKLFLTLETTGDHARLHGQIFDAVQSEKLPLHTVRPFSFGQIVLAEQSNLDPDDPETIIELLSQTVCVDQGSCANA